MNQQGVQPKADTLDFPASAQIDVTGQWLIVANANSDLRYNDGTLVVLDVLTAANDRNSVLNPDPDAPAPPVGSFAPCPTLNFTNSYDSPQNGQPAFCCWDQLDRTILNCDERRYIMPPSTVRMGSFGAGMVYQPACDPTAPCDQEANCDASALAKDGRLFVGVRGNSSVTYADISYAQVETTVVTTAGRKVVTKTAPVFDCTGDSAPDSFTECDSTHEITLPHEEVSGQVLPDEPYALTMDPQRQLLYIGHLKGDVSHPDTGGVSLFEVGGAANAADERPVPAFLRAFPPIFAPDVNGFFGVTSLTVSGAMGNPNELFVSSRYTPRVGSMVPTAESMDQMCHGGVGRSPALVQGPHTFDTTLSGSEDRGIVFAPAPLNRAYVLQRNPPALVGFDTIPDPLTGVLHPTDVIETCSNPTFLQAHNPGHAGWQLYVTCFETGQIYIVDPSVPRIVNTINAGNGPAGLAFGPGPAEQPTYVPATDFDFTTRAYVVGFGDNNIGVIELDPTSADQYHMIERIGFASTVPR